MLPGPWPCAPYLQDLVERAHRPPRAQRRRHLRSSSMKDFAYTALKRDTIATRALRWGQLHASRVRALRQALQNPEKGRNRHVVPQQVPRDSARTHNVRRARGDRVPACVCAQSGQKGGVGPDGL